MIIAPLFPEEVVTEEVTQQEVLGDLFPEEEILISKAVPKRKQEFRAGRVCSRRALARLQIHDFPLLAGEDRTPIWPQGIVGSIAHTGGYCGVAVARNSHVRSVGLDVECIGEVERDVWEKVCLTEELSWLRCQASHKQDQIAALIFAAKECLYKCQYMISRQWLDFHDIKISIFYNENEYTAEILPDVPGFFNNGAEFRGKFLFHRDLVFTGMTLVDNQDSTGN